MEQEERVQRAARARAHQHELLWRLHPEEEAGRHARDQLVRRCARRRRSQIARHNYRSVPCRSSTCACARVRTAAGAVRRQRVRGCRRGRRRQRVIVERALALHESHHAAHSAARQERVRVERQQVSDGRRGGELGARGGGGRLRRRAVLHDEQRGQVAQRGHQLALRALLLLQDVLSGRFVLCT